MIEGMLRRVGGWLAGITRYSIHCWGDPFNKIVVGQAYYLIEGLVECQAAGRLEPVDYPVDRSINV